MLLVEIGGKNGYGNCSEGCLGIKEYSRIINQNTPFFLRFSALSILLIFNLYSLFLFSLSLAEVTLKIRFYLTIYCTIYYKTASIPLCRNLSLGRIWRRWSFMGRMQRQTF